MIVGFLALFIALLIVTGIYIAWLSGLHKIEAEAAIQTDVQFRRPSPGYQWNPLKAHRNIPCPCQSGLKSKKCCGLFWVLPDDVAEKVKHVIG